jgi:hypothetical protein
MLDKNLLAVYEQAFAQHGANHGMVIELRSIISRHFPKYRDKVFSPDLHITGASTGTRKGVSLSSYYNGEVDKKKLKLSDVVDKVNPEPITEVITKKAAEKEQKGEVVTPELSEEVLLDWTTKTAEELLELVGRDSLAEAAKKLGYKIHHKTSDIKFAENFLETLKKATQD